VSAWQVNHSACSFICASVGSGKTGGMGYGSDLLLGGGGVTGVVVVTAVFFTGLGAGFLFGVPQATIKNIKGNKIRIKAPLPCVNKMRQVLRTHYHTKSSKLKNILRFSYQIVNKIYDITARPANKFAGYQGDDASLPRLSFLIQIVNKIYDITARPTNKFAGY
jgi:hypothetical protein